MTIYLIYLPVLTLYYIINNNISIYPQSEAILDSKLTVSQKQTNRTYNSINEIYDCRVVFIHLGL